MLSIDWPDVWKMVESIKVPLIVIGVAAKTFVCLLLLSRCVSLCRDRSVSSVCLLSSAARRPPHSALRTSHSVLRHLLV